MFAGVYTDLAPSEGTQGPFSAALVDYTNDGNALRAGLSRLGIRGRTEGGAQLMEAILTAAREVKGEAERSALVVCRIGGESQTTMRAQEIRRELIRRGTVLYVSLHGRPRQRRR